MTSTIFGLLCASLITFGSYSSEKSEAALLPEVSNVYQKPSVLNFKQLLQVVKYWKSLGNMLNSEGFIEKVGGENEQFVWVKNCKVKVDNNGNIYPQNPSESSVIIVIGLYRGVWFDITVWGKKSVDNIVTQLKEIGYKVENNNNSYLFNNPSNDIEIELSQQEYGPNSYTFRLIFTPEDY